MEAGRSDTGGDEVERLQLFLKDHDATVELGRRLGRGVEKRAIIALIGSIGAGKTTMVQGLARGLDVDELVSSPTFTMMNEYHSGRLPLYHLDLYRVQDSPEFKSVLDLITAELDELLQSDGVVVVEWAELFRDELGVQKDYLNGRDHLRVELSYGDASANKALQDLNDDLQDLNINKDGGRTAVVIACGSGSAAMLSWLVNS